MPEPREIMFETLWPMQEWNGKQAVCRAAVDAVVSRLKAAGYRIELDPDALLAKGRESGVTLK